jgi:hypothetical protein
MAAARVTGKRQLGYALKRRIAALDPEEDHEEVARLTLEVLYGDPIGVHAALLIGFSRQVAVPGPRAGSRARPDAWDGRSCSR